MTLIIAHGNAKIELCAEFDNRNQENIGVLTEREEAIGQSCSWVGPTHGLGRIGSRFFLAFWWIGLGRGSETFPKILNLVMCCVCNLYQAACFVNLRFGDC